jgi:hypothetical protein
LCFSALRNLSKNSKRQFFDKILRGKMLLKQV